MKKQIATLVPEFKSALSHDNGNIAAKGDEVNKVLVTELQKIHPDFDIETLDKTMLAVSNSANAVTAAAAEVSADAFKADGDLTENKFSVGFGKQIEVSAGFAREKVITARNPSTGEQMDPVTKYNHMSGGKLVIQGIGSKAVRDHSTTYGKDLLAD